MRSTYPPGFHSQEFPDMNPQTIVGSPSYPMRVNTQFAQESLNILRKKDYSCRACLSSPGVNDCVCEELHFRHCPFQQYGERGYIPCPFPKYNNQYGFNLANPYGFTTYDQRSVETASGSPYYPDTQYPIPEDFIPEPRDAVGGTHLIPTVDNDPALHFKVPQLQHVRPFIRVGDSWRAGDFYGPLPTY